MAGPHEKLNPAVPEFVPHGGDNFGELGPISQGGEPTVGKSIQDIQHDNGQSFGEPGAISHGDEPTVGKSIQDKQHDNGQSFGEPGAISHGDEPTVGKSIQDKQHDNGQSFGEPGAISQGDDATVDDDAVKNFWTYSGDSSFPEIGNEGPRIKEDNQDPTQHNLIAMASGSSTDARYFKGPRERRIRFQVSENEFLPENAKPKHGDTMVTFRISERPIASKLSFEVVVTKENSKVKHMLHPDNIVHAARLDFTLHTYGPSRPRCVQKLSIDTHFPIKKTENGDENAIAEYEYPCYIDIEFTTTGAVSHGLLDPCVADFDDEAKRVFSYLHELTRSHSQELRTVKFRIGVDPMEVEHTECLIGALQELVDCLPQSRSFKPYRAHGNDLRIIYGQQRPRALVQQDWNSDMVKFRAVSFFEDVDTYLVKMAYGAVQEWRRPYEQIKRIQEIPAKITLRKLGPHIAASVCLDQEHLRDDILPSEMKGTEVILPEYTDVKMTIFIPRESLPDKEWSASGFTIAGYDEDAAPEDIHVLLYGNRLGKLFGDSDTAITHSGVVKFDINEAPVKRQINALVKIHTNDNGVGRWVGLLLNQEPNSLPNVDLLEGIDDHVINSMISGVLGLKGWNNQQRKAFKSLRHAKGGVSILEGFPGCGKTSVLAAMAIFLYHCGLNVLLVGASNAAVDALADSLTSMEPLPYVRIRRGEVEKRSRKSACPRESGEADEASSELEKHVALIGLLQNLKSAQTRKIEGNPDYSLLSHIRRKCKQAVASGEEYLLNVAPGAQKTDIEIPSGEEPNPETHVLSNAYDVIDEYLSRPRPPRPAQSSPESEEWEARESTFKKAFDSIADLVVREASIVACTNNLAGSAIVRKNFGANGKKIIVIADEDGQALEVDAIIPLVSLDRSDLVVGTIRGGDRQQLPPLAITSMETPGYNEFGYQMGRSLFDRLRRGRFPVTIVPQQLRMHPNLSKFPSQHTYHGKMTDDPSVDSINMNADLGNLLKEWIRSHEPEAEFRQGMELIGIDVSNGQALRNDRNHSRYNQANVSVVMHLVELLITRGITKKIACAVLTTYAEQKRAYVGKMMALSKRLKVPWDEMVKIATVDSMQGHEADAVILDWVVDSGSRSDLGFASDDRRANVALTRARSCLIVVGNGNLINNDRLGQKEPRSIPPEILVHWRYLLDNDLVVRVCANLETTTSPDDISPEDATTSPEDAAIWPEDATFSHEDTATLPDNSGTWGAFDEGENAGW